MNTAGEAPAPHEHRRRDAGATTDGWRTAPHLIAWVIWAFVVVAAYYRQVWQLSSSLWSPLTDLRALRQAWLSGFPAWPEAFARAAGGLAGATLVLLAAQPLGALACRIVAWRPPDRRDRLLARTSLGLGVLAYLSLALAFGGMYTVGTVRVLVPATAAVGMAWVLAPRARARWIRPAATHTGDTDRVDPPGRARPRLLAIDVWRAISLVAIFFALIAALAPEIEYDALWYHLELPRLWQQAGRPVDLVHEYISLYPLTWDLVFGAGLALGGPVAAKLLHFACLLLCALLVYRLGELLVPHGRPWLPVAILVTTPIVLWEASTAYIDLALAFHIGLAAYALLRHDESGEAGWRRGAALNLGLALATKHLALIALATVGPLVAIHQWRASGFPRATRRTALLLLVVFAIASPWYLRSYRASGNPVFPELYGVFGASPPDRWDEVTDRGLERFQSRFGRPRSAATLATLPWDMTMHAARYGGTLGPLFLVLLPALLGFRRLPRRLVVVALAAAVYLALWASPVSSFQMRFLVPIVPLLAVAAAAAAWSIASLLERARGWTFLLHAPLALLLLMNLPPFTELHETDRVGWSGWLTHVLRTMPAGVVSGAESEQQYLTRTLPSYAAWQYLDSHAPPGSRVLTFTGGDQFYSRTDRLWSDSTAARPITWGSPAGAEPDALAALGRLHITHVLFDKRELRRTPPGSLAIACVAGLQPCQPPWIGRCLLRAYEDQRMVVYRVAGGEN
jgi:hypothetical protein